MKPDKVIEELHLKTYEYVQNQNSFVHCQTKCKNRQLN